MTDTTVAQIKSNIALLSSNWGSFGAAARLVAACTAATVSGQELTNAPAVGPITLPRADSSEEFFVAPPTNAVPSTPERPLIDQVRTTPSAFATSEESATSAIGAPRFAAVPRAASVATTLQNPFQLGPFTAHPFASYGFTYSRGLQGRGVTILHTVAPGITIQSAHLTAGYTPTLNYYTKGPYDDALNHNAFLDGSFGYGDWTFELGHSYSRSSRPLIETGVQTDSESHHTSISAHFQFSEKTSFDFSVSQQLQETSEFNNSKQWSSMNWANYHAGRKTVFGLGMGGGYVIVEQGSDMSFEQVQGRVIWKPGSKLSATINGGFEIRQFLDVEGADDQINPLMGASIGYQLFERTSLSFTANRGASVSLFQDQTTEAMTLSAALNQQLLKHLTLGISAGYRKSDYVSTSVVLDQDVTRSDTYKFASVSLSTRFFRRGSASISYQHSINDSTLEGPVSYEADQYTASISYRF